MDTLSVTSAFVAVCAAFSILPIVDFTVSKGTGGGGGYDNGRGVLSRAPCFTLATLVFFAQGLGLKLVPVATDICEPVDS